MRVFSHNMRHPLDSLSSCGIGGGCRPTDGFRRRGLASWLIYELFRWGAAIGVQNVHASWVGGNDAVGRIMREYGAEIWLSSNHWRGKVSLLSQPEVVASGELHSPKFFVTNV